MLKIEEYIAKRKKEERLDEFDLKLRDQNLRRCSDYVFEYFFNFLPSLETQRQKEAPQETVKSENPMNNQSMFLTIKEVCVVLKVSRFTVSNLIQSGKLKAHKIEKQYRIKKEDINQYLKENSRIK